VDTIDDSMNLRPPNHYDLLDKVEMFLEYAIRKRAAYHFWFHPSDPRSLFENEFKRTLGLIESQRKAGALWVTTMRDLAAYCEARAGLSLRVKERSANGMTFLIESSLDTEKYGLPEVTLIVPCVSLPERIVLEFGGAVRGLRANKDYAMRNGRLTFNVPAMDQTVRLVF